MIHVLNGKHLIIADDPAEFAHAIVSLLRDPIRRQALGNAGRALVEAKYGWDQAASRLEEVWNKVVARKPKTTG